MPSSDRRSYLVPGLAMPFCRGCGHAHVVRALDDALGSLDLDPARVCLVSDIGCIGLADGLFDTPHSVHTTHGRSTAFATGLSLADGVLGGGGLRTIVLIGDGGATIGLLHLVHAAQINVDVTVLVCNNFLFGMTGGQHSASSPVGFVTATTPGGNLTPPLDLCRVLEQAHAGFTARHLATDRDLAGTIARAIAYPGFAVVEIVELCPAHAAPHNTLSASAVRATLADAGHALGVIEKPARPTFAAAYAARFPPGRAREKPSDAIDVVTSRHLARPVGLVIAGSAGERVQSAAHRLCRAAARCGLFSTQRNDNPVTQGSGFSLAEVILSSSEVHYTGLERPDALIAVSHDGLAEVLAQGLWDRLGAGSLALVDATLDPPPTPARVERAAFRTGRDGSHAAAKAIEHFVRVTGVFPVEALAHA